MMHKCTLFPKRAIKLHTKFESTISRVQLPELHNIPTTQLRYHLKTYYPSYIGKHKHPIAKRQISQTQVDLLHLNPLATLSKE